jgi:hypothetical protein
MPETYVRTIFLAFGEKTSFLLFMLRKERLSPLSIEYHMPCQGYCIIILLTKIS